MSAPTALSPVPQTFDTLDLMVEGFLSRFDSEATRTAYAGDLAMWRQWCDDFGLDPLTVERGHIEMYARWLASARGNSVDLVVR